MVVRQLGAEDAGDYRALRLRALQLHPDAFGSSYEEEVGQPVANFSNALLSQLVVGCLNGSELVGVAGLYRSNSPKTKHRGVVWGMFVAPEDRRAGAGGRLLAAIVEHARHEVEDLTLSVASHNEAAIGLYRRFGFAEYGHDRRALKIGDQYVDELLMRFVL